MYSLLLFTFEITVAEVLFSFGLKKRGLFALRLLAWFAVMAGAAALCMLLPDVVFANALVMSMLFIGLFILSVLLMTLCYDERWVNVFFCGICAYTLQHMAYGFANLLISLILQTRSPVLDLYSGGGGANIFGNEPALVFLLYFLCVYFIYGICFLLFRRRVGKDRAINIDNSQVPVLIAVGLLVDIALNMVCVYLVPSDVAFIVNVIFSVYSCAASVLFLTVLFGIARNKKLEEEKNLIEYIAKKQADLYAVSKENRDLVNMKAHDMKYLLREMDEKKRVPEEALTELRSVLAVSDTFVTTGNDTLDTLLSERSMYCANNGVTFTCLADGKAVSFLTDADMYSLFGNALDNATEAVMKIADPAARTIGLRLAAEDKFVTLTVYNSYEGEIATKDGMPVSAKKDAAFHGFGIKSIRYTVDKYGGDMSVRWKDGVFTLNILFPVPSSVGGKA